jgi:hypothetical protein
MTSTHAPLTSPRGLAARILSRIAARRGRIVTHRSTWPNTPEFRGLEETAVREREQWESRANSAEEYRRAVAAFYAAHGHAPRVDSRFPSERRLALWQRSQFSTPSPKARHNGTKSLRYV